MKKVLFSVLLVAASAAVWSGCVRGGAYAPVNATKYNQETDLQFALMDPGTEKSVTCSLLQTRNLPDGRLEVAAVVRNRENRRIQVQVQCLFKDEQGVSVDETPWQTLILTENSQEAVRYTSLNNQARKFTIRVRQAR